MLRQFLVMTVALLSLAAGIAACASNPPTPVPGNAAFRTEPPAGPGTCTPPPGTGTCQ